MKRIILVISLTVFTLAMYGQKSPVDELFDKYNGREGFTSVYISSKMFSLLSRLDSDDEEFRNLVTRIKSIRILSTDKEKNLPEVNFVAELMPKLKRSGYEELMTVKEENDEVWFMVQEAGGKITELVMITGGEGTSVVSIKGDLDLKTIASMSDSMDIKGLEGLDKVEK